MSTKNTMKFYNDRFSTNLICIKLSNIPSAGFGAFAKQQLPANIVLGEYNGIRINNTYISANLDQYKSNKYLFAIKNQGKITEYVDAKELNSSNWTRFINGSKNNTYKTNVEAYQYQKKIRIKTIKKIAKGEEIILNYGKLYWKNLKTYS